ncbi:MAG: NUDIX domain-containing protein [Clostridia bacterium]|nr:NUDIX domain-containing protein [Clostridia bacterium]
MVNGLREDEVNQASVKKEICAMAVVLFNDKILTTNEIIYEREILSLPKGHKEKNENIIKTAIRECFEETNIVLCESDLVKKLPPYSYEFLAPNKILIKKTVYPFLFRVYSGGNPLNKEKRITMVQWMNVEEFLEKCPHESVKKTVKEALK